MSTTYKSFREGGLSLRDLLATEHMFLAYVHTGTAFLATGAPLGRFFGTLADTSFTLS